MQAPHTTAFRHKSRRFTRHMALVGAGLCATTLLGGCGETTDSTSNSAPTGPEHHLAAQVSQIEGVKTAEFTLSSEPDGKDKNQGRVEISGIEPQDWLQIAQQVDTAIALAQPDHPVLVGLKQENTEVSWLAEARTEPGLELAGLTQILTWNQQVATGLAASSTITYQDSKCQNLTLDIPREVTLEKLFQSPLFSADRKNFHCAVLGIEGTAQEVTLTTNIEFLDRLPQVLNDFRDGNQPGFSTDQEPK